MNRRKLLRNTAVLGAGAAAVTTAGVAAAATGGKEGSPTFVIVNGSNGTGMGINGLGLHGLRSVAVELPGHTTGHFPLEYQAPQDLEAWATKPSPVAGVSLGDYVDATVAVVETVAEYGPVILIGQSMGGGVITKVAGRVPELVDRLVYDAAYCCVELPTMNEYMSTEEASESLGDKLVDWIIGNPVELGVTRVNWRSADPDFLADAKAMFLADGTDEEVLTLLANLQPDESFLPVSEDASADKDTWGTVPRSYIRHTGDRMLPIALQDRMIAEADALTPDNVFDVHTVETSHAGTARAHEEILEILVGLA